MSGAGNLNRLLAGLALIVVVAALIAAPLMLSGYYIYLINLVGVYVVLALGLNVLMGDTGLFAIAHVAFYGIGIYVTGYVTNTTGLPVFVGALAAMIVASAIGYGIGMASIRLRDVYLALSTFAFAQAAQWVFLNWRGVTGGNDGFKIHGTNLFAYTMETDHQGYPVVMITVALAIVATVLLKRSRLGRSMQAIRESEPAAASVGINVMQVKAAAFAISAMYAALAGGMFTTFSTYIHPETLNFNFTVVVLTMLVVGGIGTIPGAILGAVLIGAINELLRRALSYQEVLYGVILIAFMVAAPRGVYGLMERLWLRGRVRSRG